jgi:hypothetical protein
MKNLRTLIMALPIVAMTAPALAADNLTGDYTLTMTAGRDALPVGTTVCISLKDTGTVLGFQNSGTATAGVSNGDYYAIGSVITVAFPGVILSGVLYHKGLSYGTLSMVNGGTVTGADSFTASIGCS